MCELHGPVHVVMDLYTGTYTAASAVGSAAVVYTYGVMDANCSPCVDASHAYLRVREGVCALLGV